MKRLVPSLLFAVSFLGFAAATHGNAVVGQPAPGFTLTDAKGVTHSLADFAGKIVVLEWINHGCPFVQKHYSSKNMQGLQEKYTGQGIVWLSICSSAPGEQGHYSREGWLQQIEKHGMKPSAVLLDESGEVGKLYGARTTPHMYVIDAKGVLAYNGAIDSNSSSNPAVIPTSENYVAAAIAAIQAGKPVEKSTTRPYGCNVKYARDS